MLLDIFQIFSELFIRQLWTAVIIYKLSHFEKQAFVKKVFLKISQNSQENTMSESFFNKVADLKPATVLKRDSVIGVSQLIW